MSLRLTSIEVPNHDNYLLRMHGYVGEQRTVVIGVSVYHDAAWFVRYDDTARLCISVLQPLDYLFWRGSGGDGGKASSSDKDSEVPPSLLITRGYVVSGFNS